MRNLFNIASKGERYIANVIEDDDGSVFFLGDLDIDYDGCPDWHRDPCGQAETTLHYNGRPINGHEVYGIVLPPECINGVRGIVLGCKAEVRHSGIIAPAVVFDVGPRNKLGEATPSLARVLGISDDPLVGGTESQSVLYRYWPGVPANFNNMLFTLLPYS